MSRLFTGLDEKSLSDSEFADNDEEIQVTQTVDSYGRSTRYRTRSKSPIQIKTASMHARGITCKFYILRRAQKSMYSELLFQIHKPTRENPLKEKETKDMFKTYGNLGLKRTAKKLKGRRWGQRRRTGEER